MHELHAVKTQANSRFEGLPKNDSSEKAGTQGCVKVPQSILWQKPFIRLYSEPRLVLFGVALISSSSLGYWERDGVTIPSGYVLASCEELARAIPIGSLRVKESLTALTRAGYIEDFGVLPRNGRCYERLQVKDNSKSLLIQGSPKANLHWEEQTIPCLTIDKRIQYKGELFRELGTEGDYQIDIAKLRSVLIALTLISISPNTIPLEVAEIASRASARGFVITRREISRLAGADLTASKGGDVDKYLSELQAKKLVTIHNYEEFDSVGYYTLSVSMDWCIPKEQEQEATPQASTLTKPTIEEAQAYCKMNGLSKDVEAWHTYYTKKNWRTARGEFITDWRTSLTKWRDKQAG